MPTDYQCNDCGLQFSVGPFRYHHREISVIATYFVCSGCGTWHMSERVKPGKGTLRFLAQPQPQIRYPKVGRAPMVPAENWLVLHGVPGVFHFKAGLSKALKTMIAPRSALRCGYCGEEGSLISTIKGNACPHCKKQSLEARYSYSR